MYQRKKEHDEGGLVLQMEKREKKRRESEIIKILNAYARVTVHICIVTVAIVHLCSILHALMWVFFCSKCVKSASFSILHNIAHIDANALSNHYKSTGEIVLTNLGFSLEVDPPEDKFFQGSCQSSSPIGKQSH